LVEFTTSAQLQHFLARSDLKINGQHLQVHQVRARWRPCDILDFMSEELRLRAESALLSRQVDHSRSDGPRLRPMERAALEKAPLHHSTPLPRSPHDGPKGVANPKPRPSTPTSGHGSYATKPWCRGCKQEGRPHDHAWYRCPHGTRDPNVAPKEGSTPLRRDAPSHLPLWARVAKGVESPPWPNRDAGVVVGSLLHGNACNSHSKW
jgi:hypothetical protein